MDGRVRLGTQRHRKNNTPPSGRAADRGAGAGAGASDGLCQDLCYHRRRPGRDLHHLRHRPRRGAGSGRTDPGTIRHLHHTDRGGRGGNHHLPLPACHGGLPRRGNDGNHLWRDGRGAAVPAEPGAGGVRRTLPRSGNPDQRRYGSSGGQHHQDPGDLHRRHPPHRYLLQRRHHPRRHPGGADFGRGR